MIQQAPSQTNRLALLAGKAIRLSVIVPFAPDELEGGILLQQLCALPMDCEIIAVRSGSRPLPVPATLAGGTPELRECLSPPGRARQMNVGAQAARGHWLWFLHADSCLHARTLPALHAFLDRSGDALGYFTLRYGGDGPILAQLNALGANWRARVLGLPFGDQGFVLPTVWFARLGGYDENAAYGEDHLLVWRARVAGLPLRCIDAPLLSSARKYAREGWLRTTARHLALTARQAWPQWRNLRADAQYDRARAVLTTPSAAMPAAGAALAVFVKTPGHSPIKTRLAEAIGSDNAVAFHRLAARVVMDVAHATHDGKRDLQPYWAVAEHDALNEACWSDAPTLWQGDGGLGARLHRVYATLQTRHDRVLLVGADAPQITPALLGVALAALDDPATPFVLGRAEDGGFWLFGGRVPIAESVWHGVRYSCADTAKQLRDGLAPCGGIAILTRLNDVDHAADLEGLAAALAALPEQQPAQQALARWLDGLHTTGSVT